MAEPPNALTDLLWYKSPEEMYEILKREECLSSTAIENRDQVAALMKQPDAAARLEQARGMVGATPQYQVVVVLLGASYLSDKARKLLATNTVDQVRKKCTHTIFE